MKQNLNCPKCGGVMENSGDKLICPYCEEVVLVQNKTEVTQNPQISAKEQADAFVAALKRQKEEEEEEQRRIRLAAIKQQKKLEEEEQEKKDNKTGCAILIIIAVLVFIFFASNL